jgi:hypothetical protein
MKWNGGCRRSWLHVPRDPEVIDLLKNFSGAGPLPAR